MYPYSSNSLNQELAYNDSNQDNVNRQELDPAFSVDSKKANNRPVPLPGEINRPKPTPPATLPGEINRPKPTPPTTLPGEINRPKPTPPTTLPGEINRPKPTPPTTLPGQVRPPRPGNNQNPPPRPPRPGNNRPPSNNGRPSGRPPTIIPERRPMPRAVDPGSIRGCLYSYTYVWLRNGSGFWFFPTYLGARSIAGFRWSPAGWAYMGFDLNSIDGFSCGGY